MSERADKGADPTQALIRELRQHSMDMSNGYTHLTARASQALAVSEAENQRLRDALEGIEQLMPGTYVAQIVREALAGDGE